MLHSTDVRLNFKKLDVEAKIPTRAFGGDAGLDIYALEDTFIRVGATVKIPTGISVAIPFGMVGKIEDRSGMALKGLRTGAGVIDCSYRGELCIVMHNLNHNYGYQNGDYGYRIKKGDKIAQLLVYKVELMVPAEVSSLDETDRGTSGFGSTGV